MKKLIIFIFTAFYLTISTMTMASIDENVFLFGDQEVIEMQIITDAEMQATEGQLFGITLEYLSNLSRELSYEKTLFDKVKFLGKLALFEIFTFGKDCLWC